MSDWTDSIEFKPLPATPFTDDGIPYATHDGVFRLGTVEIRVYQLSNGKRVLDADDMERLFKP